MSIQDIPHFLILEILKHTTLFDRSRFSRTCRKYRRYSPDENQLQKLNAIYENQIKYHVNYHGFCTYCNHKLTPIIYDCMGFGGKSYKSTCKKCALLKKKRPIGFLAILNKNKKNLNKINKKITSKCESCCRDERTHKCQNCDSDICKRCRFSDKCDLCFPRAKLCCGSITSMKCLECNEFICKKCKHDSLTICKECFIF